jgi:hypothetical protein
MFVSRYVISVSYDPRDEITTGHFAIPDFDDGEVNLTIHFQPAQLNSLQERKVEPKPLGVLRTVVQVLAAHPTAQVTLVGVETLPTDAIPAHECDGAKTVPIESFPALIHLLKKAAGQGEDGTHFVGTLDIFTSDEYRKRVGDKVFKLETVPPREV